MKRHIKYVMILENTIYHILASFKWMLLYKREQSPRKNIVHNYIEAGVIYCFLSETDLISPFSRLKINLFYLCDLGCH